MFAVTTFVLLALAHPVISQSPSSGGSDNNSGVGPDFQPDPLTTVCNPTSNNFRFFDLTVPNIQGILTLFCIFTFFFLLLTGWCFVTLILARGHRAPYALLFPALILSVLANGANIGLEIFLNMPSWYNLPTQLQPALEAIGLFFTNLAILLLFLSIIAVLWDRETAIHAATEGKACRRNHGFTVVYAVLAFILFVLGIAGPAVYIYAIRKYFIALNAIDFNFDTNASLEQYQLELWLNQRQKVWNDLFYTFDAFVVLTGVVVAVSTILLWRAGRAAGIRDKVLAYHSFVSAESDNPILCQITNIMFYAVAPLYAAYNLFTFIFTIVFSNHGLPATSSQAAFEAATLAQNLLLLGSYFVVAFVLIFMSNRTNWIIQGGTVQPSTVYLSTNLNTELLTNDENCLTNYQ